MRTHLRFVLPIAALAALLGVSLALYAQAAGPPTKGKDEKATTADLTGVWSQNQPASTRAYNNFTFFKDEPPMTPWAEAKYKTAKPSFGPHSFPISETNDPVYHGCFPPGVPRVFLHPLIMEIVQTPTRVIFLFEYDQARRVIYTDGRGHDTAVAPTWMGDSTGHWEGDTLVVDTVNFNDKTWLDRVGHPHSEALHLVERLRRPDQNTLVDEMAMEDPKAYTKPLTAQLVYRLRPTWKVLEQFCEDNETFEGVEKVVTAPKP
jgi:hypothetical protein